MDVVMLRRMVWVGFLPFMVSTSFAQSLLVGPNVNINRQSGYQAEVSITIDRSNPNRVFAWSNELTGTRNSAAVSTNGGLTWTSRFTSAGDGWPGLGGDPTSTSDQFGIYGASFNSATTGAVVGRSTDGGLTYSVATTITIGDQPTISAGQGTAQGSLWITYQRAGAIRARGATTSAGGIGAFSAELTPTGGSGGNFGDIAIGPGGRVVVGYQNPSGGVGPSTITVQRNITGIGGSFTAGAGIATNVGGFRPIPAQPSRTVDSEMGLAYDVSGGPRNGRLYMVYTDAVNTTTNDLNIFFRSSNDDGATWSAPTRVNTDIGTNSQFFSKIAVDPITGNIGIAWYDARNDPANQRVEVWGTVSTDGGATFLPEVKISAGSTLGIGAGGGNELGDYIGLDFYNNVLMPAWGDNSNSTGDNPDGTGNLDYYTARVILAVPEPATMALVGLSLAGVGYWVVRQRRQHELAMQAAVTS